MALAAYAYYEDSALTGDTTPATMQNTEKSRWITG